MIGRSMGAEFAKLRRSRPVLWTFAAVLAFAAVSLAVGPSLGGEEGNAALSEAGGMWKQAVEAGIYDDTWKASLHQLPMAMTSGLALLLFAFVTAYVFGHEFKEHTIVNALTTPNRREYLVASKMVVVAAWTAVLTALLFACHVGVTMLIGAPAGFSWPTLARGLGEAFAVAGMLYLTLPLFALLAVWGRGYLRPMLGAVVLMGMGNGLASTDLSPYYPVNMPLHLYGTSWMPLPAAQLVAGSWVVLAVWFGLGLGATMLYIDRADIAA